MEANYLYGKKYVALGSSSTEGDFNGYVDSNGVEDPKSPEVYDHEMKMYKTYPYWIAKRNDMELLNMSKCGGTMTYMPEIGRNGNERSLSTLYREVPLDADYITIWIGTNDHHKKAPIGALTDNTLTTFCGAWNVVLRHLITNLPYAKIGIIIPNACTCQAYPDAIRKMARRWGIPYLDLNDGYDVPVINRISGRPEMCDEARNIRTEAFKVSQTNGHPNLQAHMFLSTAVENFMRSL
ncbi:MAG: SGNH/GDSL hydrolase family protein [Clostridia bacterium]|nr:SGNH/GDSL hydrolase family protein [Clostridia bacterium]